MSSAHISIVCIEYHLSLEATRGGEKRIHLKAELEGANFSFH